MSLSIIIPTMGRPSIVWTLRSVIPELLPGDEAIVIGDGPQPISKEVAIEAGARYLETQPTRQWGHAQRNLGMEQAKGDYLAFIDDDDLYLQGAFQAMRRAIEEAPGKLFIFRMQYKGGILWDKPELAINNISTQMFVFPNVPGRLARWGRHPKTPNGKGGDWCFAKDTAFLNPAQDIVFRPEVIARLDAHGEGRIQPTG
jgi:glycosyltransferase involved in cell wall biosynthesis